MKLILSVLLLLLFGCGNAQHPNVILILTDDQGWGDVSMNGNTNLATPNIDKLAKEGITFDKFYVAAVCSPTRAEILTGRYHVRSGVYSTSAGGERIDADETTLGDVFKKAGYATAAYGKWHSGMQAPYHPNSRGFDDYYGFASGHWGNYFSPMLEHNGEIVQGKGFLPDDLTDHALAFIERNKRKPFFLYIPYNTPHSPMQVPEKYWDKMKDKPLSMFNRKAEQEDTLFTKAALAMVENIDDNVGRIVDHVEKLKLSKETIIIYLSDNGPNGVRWNGEMKGRKGSTDEGGVRSPMIMKWKSKLPADTKHERIASAVDLLPTLVALAEIEHTSNKPLDGIDVFADKRDRVIYNYWQKKLSLRSQKFRLDHNDALFDMEEDPGQYMDVRFDHSEVYKDLIDKKKIWIRDVASALDTETKRPITLGHPSMNLYQLPARDAVTTGNIERSNRWPNCSFFTNWTAKEEEIYWDLEVIEAGVYEVEIYYTCAAQNLGSTFELSLGESRLEAKIEVAHDPPLMGAEDDIVTRMESYIKDFRPLTMGEITLVKGNEKLALKALNIPGQEVMDFRLLMFKKIE